ncbi:uncharacterized protein LOC122856402 [Aphidius gifuensis]|uniref:uncharacterized protein LOC122856402 n=1 Tax=Aphidius gifuensis TaxID=684658 RepID=UPI001CDB9AB4|nr:uncharacterized protein LOC122856402 [Aphidius gifuensis]
MTEHAHWRHIPGTQNPADCASRGITTKQLEESNLWWNGPPWLRLSEDHWPKQKHEADELCEQEARPGITLVATQAEKDYSWQLVHKYSSWTKLLRITSHVIRFISLLKRKPVQQHQSIMEAKKYWIRTTQSIFFSPEINALQKNVKLSPAHQFNKLTAFIDSEGIIRVGGRLENSPLNYESKHQAILPRVSRVTQLIIDHAHNLTLHGGTQLTLGHIRQSYWIIGGRSSVKSHVLKCVVCSRQRGIRAQQQMGQLPPSRVTPARAFTHTGVDYAGPLTLKTWKGRGAKIVKGWICAFVCMTTSAAHLEVVSDYSTEGFLAIFKRFTSRRGIPAHIYSDCGTNFVGADRELKKLFTQHTKENESIHTVTLEHAIQWHFNPPAAPHMGGKWEALIKSTEFHLKRTVGDAKLTYEEAVTLLAQIEAILNSRPLEPLSDDPTDLMTLTPGHFLIGSSLNSVPEHSLLDLKTNRLSRWQFIQQQVQQFWKQWSTQYLHRQQSISKWHHSNNNILIGSLVLISDERTPPGTWPLARVTRLFPGADGHTRVVELKTATTTLTRPIAKLVILYTPSTT